MDSSIDLVLSVLIISGGAGFALSIFLMLVTRGSGGSLRPWAIMMGICVSLYLVAGAIGAVMRAESAGMGDRVAR